MNSEIKQFIKESSLSEESKLSIKFLVQSIEGEVNQFTDKSYLLEGDPGIGKTYFVENLLKMLDFPILYLGPFKLENKNVRRFNNLKQVMEELPSIEKGIIYIDDLQNSLEFERDGMGDVHLTDSESKRFLNLLEIIKRTNKKIFLIMTVNDPSFMEDPWRDRIETSISLVEPSENNKKEFLKKKYSSLIGKRIISEIAKKTIGYNFRNLDEVIRIAYRIGAGTFNINSINKAIGSFTPSGLAHFKVDFKTKLNFNDVIGHDKIKRELKKIDLYVKNRKKMEKLQIKRSNLLIFSGTYGVGKTHLARALAGELSLPIIMIRAEDLHHRPTPFFGIRMIMDAAKRYKNCIVFIDEADKLLGMNACSLEEEGAILSEFNKQVDDALRNPESIIILSVNNLLRLGKAMKDRFNVIEFSKPTFEDRREFITRMIEKSELKLDISAIDLAEKTEDRNYRDLQKIWNDIVFYYLENNKMDKDILDNLLAPYQQQTKSIGIG